MSKIVIIVIAVVVAGVLGYFVVLPMLGITMWTFSISPDTTPEISCVANPVGEIASSIETAATGAGAVTRVLCVESEGEEITTTILADSISSVDGLTFKCGGGVCSGGGPLTVTEDSITAKSKANFKIRINCPGSDCELTVIDA